MCKTNKPILLLIDKKKATKLVAFLNVIVNKLVQRRNT